MGSSLISLIFYNPLTLIDIIELMALMSILFIGQRQFGRQITILAFELNFTYFIRHAIKLKKHTGTGL